MQRTRRPIRTPTNLSTCREEAAIEEPLRLSDERIASVVAVLKAAGAKRVLDLGSGEGQLIKALLKGSP